MNSKWIIDEEISDRLQNRSIDKTEKEKSEDWDKLRKKYSVGDLIKGTIFIKAPFGIFLDINEIYPALLEVIQIKDLDYESYLNDECYKLGEELVSKIAYLEKDSRQIRLSLKI